MKEISAEQRAREILDRMDIDGAQSFSAGEVVELANVLRIADDDARRLNWLEELGGVDIARAIDQPMMGEDFMQVPTLDFCIIEEDGGRLLGHGATLRQAIDAAMLAERARM